MDILLDLWSHIAPAHLLEDRPPVGSPIYLVLLGIFIAVVTLGSVVTLWVGRWAGGNRLHAAILSRYSSAAVWIAGYGILAVALRYTSAIFFAKRLWVFLAVVGLIGLALHLLWYRWAQYPEEAARYREEERRRRYLSPPRAAMRGRRARRSRARQ